MDSDSLQFNIDDGSYLSKAAFEIFFACMFREAANVDLIGL